MPEELPIPPDARRHPSVEALRVWIANDEQHISINIGVFGSDPREEAFAWGLVMADMIQHIANAHASAYGRDPEEVVSDILQGFQAEMDNPTTDHPGDFLDSEDDRPPPAGP